MSLDFSLYAVDQDDNEICVYDGNITHNLTDMAREAGIYKALWRPEEINAEKAEDIANILHDGLIQMKSNPKRFQFFNASNGFGTYKHFVPFVEEVLDACKKYPSAKISIYR